MKKLVEYISDAISDAVNEDQVKKSGTSFTETGENALDLIINDKPFKIFNICRKRVNEYFGISTGVEIVKYLFDSIIKLNGITQLPYKWATNKLYIKISYSYNKCGEIQTAIKETNDIYSNSNLKLEYTKMDNKVKVYLKNKKNYKQSLFLFETGEGSNKNNPSTAQQEIGTCVIWNYFVNQFCEKYRDKNNENNNDDKQFLKYIETLDVSDSYIKSIMDNNIFSKFNKSWLISFKKQVLAMARIFTEIGCNPADYNTSRFGDISGDRADDVCILYTQFVNLYSNKLGNSKNVYDPSDIIIYNRTKLKEIEGTLKYCIGMLNDKDNIDITGARQHYVDELFKKRLCMGISLKKLNGINDDYDFFNDDEDTDIRIKNLEITSVQFRGNNNSAKNVKISCKCNFTSGIKVSDPETGELINKSGLKNINIVLRTFGSGQVAVDCFLHNADGSNDKNPPIGKCPVGIWKPLFVSDKNIKNDKRTIDEWIDIFGQRFSEYYTIGNDNKKNYTGAASKPKSTDTKEKKAYKDLVEDMQEIISGAFKYGSTCFPFILMY